MTIAEMLLPELDHEAAVTRLLLERAPGGRLSWTPHPKSWTLGDLCRHLAWLPAWGVTIMQDAAFDLHPPDGSTVPRPQLETHTAILEGFDAHVGRARDAIARASDPEFLARWTLLDAGRAVFTMPRIAVLRSMVLSHMVHHRGQLSVYLRLCDVPLPPIYGPTADSLTEGRH